MQKKRQKHYFNKKNFKKYFKNAIKTSEEHKNITLATTYCGIDSRHQNFNNLKLVLKLSNLECVWI